MTPEQVCLNCGACCAYYRVSFYWAEADLDTSDRVPIQLTEKLDPFRLVMQGTRSRPARCVALEGKVGRAVRCTIYENRPSPCHHLQPAWVNGVPSELCDRARLAWGLPTLKPEEMLIRDDQPEQPVAPPATLINT